MTWTFPQYTRSQVDRAGEVLRGSPATESARQAAKAVMDNWRASHGYPLNTIQVLLRDRARRVDDRSMVAQRLKRLPSIIEKLGRFPTMNLTQVQDIGGCRAIVASVPRVQRLRRIFVQRETAHELVHTKDYIAAPQDDGYRGIHLVYRHRSRTHPECDRLLIEVQLRSRLQHLWATAVETVDTFENEALKVGRGHPQWARFFALMGSVVAAREGSPPVPGTPVSERERKRELKALVADLAVRRAMRAYGMALTHVESARLPSAELFLLVLTPGDTPGHFTLRVSEYTREEREAANRDYSAEEERLREDASAHVVLVGVTSLRRLRRAYPNYFLDTEAFLEMVNEAVG